MLLQNTTTSETFKWNDLQEDLNFARTALRKMVDRNAKRKAGVQDENSDKTEVSLFGSGASINLRKSLYLKTGVDIEEFSEESKHRIRQGATLRAGESVATAPSSEEDVRGGKEKAEVSEEKGQTSPEGETTGGVIALSEDKVNEIFIQEMKRLGALAMRNTYDRGILANLWEIFFPISFRKTLGFATPHSKTE